MKRPPLLKEIARKYKKDIKIFLEESLKLDIALPNGQNTIVQKNDEIKLLKALGIFNNHVAKKETNQKKSKSEIKFSFQEDSISTIKTIFRENTIYSIFLHEDIINGFNEAIKKRISLILYQLFAHGKPSSIVKGTGQGWRRTPLGGNGGFQYYLWWAPKGAPPVKEIDCKDGSIFIRQIRTHDDHSILNCDEFSNYFPINVSDLIEDKESFIEPWTNNQKEFCSGEDSIRILNGSPGSGKTTALWNATNLRVNEKVLYITRSDFLVTKAKEYFNVFSPKSTNVDCISFADLLNKILLFNKDEIFMPPDETYKLFKNTILKIPQNILGKWNTQIYSLWSVIRAFLIGYSQPDIPGDLESCRPRLNDLKFQEIEIPGINKTEIQSILEVVNYIEKKVCHIEDFFKDLKFAFKATQKLIEDNDLPQELYLINRIVIDEIQDLTILETLVPIFLARKIAEKNISRKVPFLFFAGDPSQTVIPTGFKWGPFKDLLKKHLIKPKEFILESNVRSPQNISTLVNKASDLYSNIPKKGRPKGANLNPNINESTNDQVYYCKTSVNEEIKSVLDAFVEEPDLAIICLENDFPSYINKNVLEVIQTPEMVKGRDIQKVCILNASNYLSEIKKEYEFYKNDKEDVIWKRTLIDRFRVALSRSTEVLIFIDIDYDSENQLEIEKFLQNTNFIPVEPNNITTFLQEKDPEEIVRGCIRDAEESIERNPALAWRRARQAIGRLGDPNKPNSVTDESLRQEAYIACMKSALFAVNLKKDTSENIEILKIGKDSAIKAGRNDVSQLYISIRNSLKENINILTILELCSSLNRFTNLDPWIEVNLKSKFSKMWKKQLDLSLFKLSEIELVDYSKLLSKLYKTLFIVNYKDAANETIVSMSKDFIENKDFSKALKILNILTKPPDLFVAKCYEGLNNFQEAANYFEKAKEWNSALKYYRQIANLSRAIRCLENLPKHPDIDTINWIKKIWDVLNERPKESKLTEEERKKINNFISNL